MNNDNEEPHFLQGAERRRFFEEHNLPDDAFVVPWKVALEMAEPFPRCGRVIDADLARRIVGDGTDASDGFTCGRPAGHLWPCRPEPNPLDLLDQGRRRTGEQ